MLKSSFKLKNIRRIKAKFAANKYVPKVYTCKERWVELFRSMTSCCRKEMYDEIRPKKEVVPPKKSEIREAKRKYQNSKKEFYKVNK